jgi:hypothetical protein
MNLFTVKQWSAPQVQFKTARQAVGYAVKLINPGAQSKAGLIVYLHRSLTTYFAIEYGDVVIRHFTSHEDGATKRIITYTTIP